MLIHGSILVSLLWLVEQIPYSQNGLDHGVGHPVLSVLSHRSSRWTEGLAVAPRMPGSP